MLFSAISASALTIINLILVIACVICFILGTYLGHKLKGEPAMATIFNMDIHWNIWFYVAAIICLIIAVIW